MRIGIRGLAAGLGGVAVALYAGICAYMYHTQDSQVYPGAAHVQPLPAPDTVALSGFESRTLDTPDGEHLKAWWHAPIAGQGVVLYLHGNSQNLAADWRVRRLRGLAEAGFGVLGIEYRGFGGSSGHPSEPGLITDAETAFDFVRHEAPESKIALYGESLGTGVAVALATRRPVAGIVLDSPYASILRLASAGYSWLPVSVLLNSPWKSEDRIKELHIPILINHCDSDTVIPLAEAQRLFAAANQPKQMIVLPGCGHVETWSDPARATLFSDFSAWLGGN